MHIRLAHTHVSERYAYALVSTPEGNVSHKGVGKDIIKDVY